MEDTHSYTTVAVAVVVITRQYGAVSLLNVLTHSQSGGNSQCAKGVDFHRFAQNVDIERIPGSRHDSGIIDKHIDLRVAGLFKSVNEARRPCVVCDVHPIDHVDVAVVVEQACCVRLRFSSVHVIIFARCWGAKWVRASPWCRYCTSWRDSRE